MKYFGQYLSICCLRNARSSHGDKNSGSQAGELWRTRRDLACVALSRGALMGQIALDLGDSRASERFLRDGLSILESAPERRDSACCALAMHSRRSAGPPRRSSSIAKCCTSTSGLSIRRGHADRGNDCVPARHLRARAWFRLGSAHEAMAAACTGLDSYTATIKSLDDGA